MQLEFFHLDRSAANLKHNIENYKQLRLRALKESPESFASKLETESQLSDNVWLSRIQDPSKEHFICGVRSDDRLEWVASATIRGPVPADDFRLPLESGQAEPEADEKQVKWQMLGLFTLVEYRGNGIAKRLCQAVFDYLHSLYRADQESESPEILLRIMVKPLNQVVIGMYESLGFLRTGTCTLAEALIANGDSEMVPVGTLSPEFTLRQGVIMAKRI